MGKKVFLGIVLLFVAGSLVFAGGAKEAERTKLIAAADISYPPFEYMEGSTAVGFDIDMWKEIGVRIGIPTEHANYAWDGLIPGLLAKKFDVIMSDMGITAKREEQVDFSIPYFKQSFGLCVRADSGIKSLADLEGKIIGIQTGTMAEKWVQDNATQIKVKEVVAYEVMPDTILDLQAGRIHAAVNDRPFLAYITKGKTDVYLLPDVAFGDNIFIGIAFHPEDDELREKVNEAIKAIVADGTYSKIYEKWFGRKPSAADMPF